MRRSAPSAQRNREPIGAVLKTFVKPGDIALEIAAGSGEHAVYLSELLPVAQWWPTDKDPDALSSIDAWRRHCGSDTMQPAQVLDVQDAVPDIQARLAQAGMQPVQTNLVTCINMIHISPWSATQGLMKLAQSLLAPDGILYLYGPYQRQGGHTAASNVAFDADLQARNPAWGVRHLEDVVQLASDHELLLVDTISMPANNLSVVFRRR